MLYYKIYVTINLTIINMKLLLKLKLSIFTIGFTYPQSYCENVFLYNIFVLHGCIYLIICDYIIALFILNLTFTTLIFKLVNEALYKPPL